MRISYIILFIPLILVACGGPNRNDWLDGQIRHPRPKDSPVEIFITKMPDRPYKEIALLRFKTEDNARDLTEKYRNYTNRLGGEAVIVRGPGAAHNDPGLLFDKSYTMTEAVVIEYTDKTK
jgi:hypothetical protein